MPPRFLPSWRQWKKRLAGRTTRLGRPRIMPFVFRHDGGHRILHLANRDDREAPLSSGAGWRRLVEMICPAGAAKYFCGEEWTVESALIGFAKFDFSRNAKAFTWRASPTDMTS